MPSDPRLTYSKLKDAYRFWQELESKDPESLRVFLEIKPEQPGNNGLAPESWYAESPNPSPYTKTGEYSHEIPPK
jgi:hypothetical protein